MLKKLFLVFSLLFLNKAVSQNFMMGGSPYETGGYFTYEFDENNNIKFKVTKYGEENYKVEITSIYTNLPAEYTSNYTYPSRDENNSYRPRTAQGNILLFSYLDPTLGYTARKISTPGSIRPELFEFKYRTDTEYYTYTENTPEPRYYIPDSFWENNDYAFFSVYYQPITDKEAPSPLSRRYVTSNYPTNFSMYQSTYQSARIDIIIYPYTDENGIKRTPINNGPVVRFFGSQGGYKNSRSSFISFAQDKEGDFLTYRWNYPIDNNRYWDPSVRKQRLVFRDQNQGGPYTETTPLYANTTDADDFYLNPYSGYIDYDHNEDRIGYRRSNVAIDQYYEGQLIGTIHNEVPFYSEPVESTNEFPIITISSDKSIGRKTSFDYNTDTPAGAVQSLSQFSQGFQTETFNPFPFIDSPDNNGETLLESVDISESETVTLTITYSDPDNDTVTLEHIPVDLDLYDTHPAIFSDDSNGNATWSWTSPQDLTAFTGLNAKSFFFAFFGEDDGGEISNIPGRTLKPFSVTVHKKPSLLISSDDFPSGGYSSNASNTLNFSITGVSDSEILSFTNTLSAADFNITNGTLLNFSQTSSTTFTGLLSSTIQSGTISITLQDDKFTVRKQGGHGLNTIDLNNKASNTFTWTIPTNPQITITSNDSFLIKGETAEITFTISEATADFSIDDISTITSGTFSNFKKISSTVYTVDLTPSQNISTTLNVTVDSNKFKGLMDNFNVSGSSSIISVNTVNPTPTLSFGFENGFNLATSLVTGTLSITFSEDVSYNGVSIGTSFTSFGNYLNSINSDTKISNFSYDNVNRVFSCDIENLNEGEIVFKVPEGALKNLAGNKNTNSSKTYTYTTSTPKVIIHGLHKNPNGSGQYLLVFSIGPTFNTTPYQTTGAQQFDAYNKPIFSDTYKLYNGSVSGPFTINRQNIISDWQTKYDRQTSVMFKPYGRASDGSYYLDFNWKLLKFSQNVLLDGWRSLKQNTTSTSSGYKFRSKNGSTEYWWFYEYFIDDNEYVNLKNFGFNLKRDGVENNVAPYGLSLASESGQIHQASDWENYFYEHPFSFSNDIRRLNLYHLNSRVTAPNSEIQEIFTYPEGNGYYQTFWYDTEIFNGNPGESEYLLWNGARTTVNTLNFSWGADNSGGNDVVFDGQTVEAGSYTYNFDTGQAVYTSGSPSTAPTITITSSDSNLELSETATLTFNLSASPDSGYPFELDDILYLSEFGSLSNFSTVSPTQYTVLFTPSSNISSTIDIGVIPGAFKASSEDNTSNSMSLIVDNIMPYASFTVSQTLLIDQTKQLTITLSEPSSDFVVGDISFNAQHLSLTNFTGVSSSVYTVDLTPLSCLDLDTPLSIDAGSFSDQIGNDNFSSVVTLTLLTTITDSPTISYGSISNPLYNSIDSIVLTSSASSTWYKDDTLVATNALTFTVTQTGEYYAKKYSGDNGGCEGPSSSTVSFTFYDESQILGPDYVFSNQTVNFHRNNVSTTTPTWNLSDLNIGVIDSSGTLTISSTSNISSTFQISYTDLWSTTISKTITYIPPPTVTRQGSSTIISLTPNSNIGILVCEGDTSVSLVGSGTASSVTPWLALDTGVVSVTSGGQITNAKEGLTKILYTDSEGGVATVNVEVIKPRIFTNNVDSSGNFIIAATTTSTILTNHSPRSTNPWESDDVSINSTSGIISPTNPPTSTVTITFTDSNGCSCDQSFLYNTLPSFSNNNLIEVTVSEGSSTTISLTNASDADSQISSVTYLLNNNSLITSNGALSSKTSTNSLAPTVTYTHDGTETLSDSFTYYAYDGLDYSTSSVTVNITVTPVNESPTITSSESTQNYTPGDDAVSLFSNTQADPIDLNQDFTEARLQITNVVEPSLELLEIDGVEIPLSTSSSSTSNINSISISNNSSTYTVSLSFTLSPTSINSLIDQIKYKYNYQNTNNSSLDRNISIVYLQDDGSDNNSNSSLSISSTINLVPQLRLTIDDNVLNSSETTTVTFTLTESSTTFDQNDITISSGGTISDFTAVDSITYAVIFTPVSSTTTTTILSVSSNTFTDIGGLNNSKTVSATISVDTLSPTVVLTDDDDDNIVREGAQSRITATFNEAMSSTPSVTIDLPSNTDIVATMTQSTTSVWYYDWTVASGDTGTATITVAGYDIVGNAYTGTDSLTFEIDTTSPTLTITTNDDRVNNTDTPTITFTLTESSTTFVKDDVTVSSGSISALTATSSRVYTAVYTPDSNTVTTVTVSVAAGMFTDIAGNTNTASNTTFEVDTVSPTVVITDNHDDLIVRDADTVLLTATFSEAMTATPTISITGLVTNTNMTASTTALVWTYSWDVPSGNDGLVSATVSGTDLFGNYYTPTNTDSITYLIDNTDPTVVLTDNDDDNIVREGAQSRITATFSEAMSSTPSVTIDLPSNTDIVATMTQYTPTYYISVVL